MPSPQVAFGPSLEPTSLAQHAYSTVRERILKGNLKLGAQISRRKLAAELGMSLLPVAEALQRLEAEGLVESRPRIGTRICQPSAQDIRERYEIREALESQAARLFAEKASPRERRELKAMAVRMDELFNECFKGRTDPESLYAIHDFHAQLHFRIAEFAGCRLLAQALERNHVMLFNWLYDVAAERPALPPSFHVDLVNAICEGDAEAADRAMRHHVRYGLQRVLRRISQNGAKRQADVSPLKKAVSSRSAVRSASKKRKRTV
jgi:DNA-binding GntR family transcriptional regulator